MRTNAFIVDREVLLSVTGRNPTSKSAVSLRERAGGLTGRLAGRGLAALAVGRDRVALGPDEWPDVELFWQGTQRGLLVSDNQTRAYEHGSPAVREALARRAWGPRARPA